MVHDWFISLSTMGMMRQKFPTPYSAIFGDYDGYVVIGKDHPYFNEGTNNISVEIHGGLTYDSYGILCQLPELKQEYATEDYRIIGFNTAHSGDSIEKWTKERTEKETCKLYGQLYMAYIKKKKDDNRTEC